VVEHIRIMQAGCEMMKVKGSKQYHRTFWLDEELTSILWNSANKKPFKARSKKAIKYLDACLNNTIIVI